MTSTDDVAGLCAALLNPVALHYNAETINAERRAAAALLESQANALRVATDAAVGMLEAVDRRATLAESERDTLRARLKEADQGWRTIDSAPKDGTRVDLWAGNVRMADCYWNASPYVQSIPWGWSNQNLGRITTATHWQPLPSAPKAQGG